MTAEQLLVELKALEQRQHPTFSVAPADLYALVACLQLTYRFPQLSDFHRSTIRNFVETMSPAFVDCPLILESIRRGWMES